MSYLAHGGESYRAAGVSTYIRELLLHLPPAGPEHDYYAFLGKDAPRLTGIREVREPISLQGAPLRIAWEQCVLPSRIRHLRCDLVHGLVNVLPLLASAPGVVTVHDLSYLRHPERFHRSKVVYLRGAVALAVRRAQHVLAVSNNTRRDLIELLHVDSERITVTYPGVHPRFHPLGTMDAEKFRQRNFAGRPYLLHVGTLEPRKNIDLLIRAYWRLRESPGIPHALAIVGARGWMYESLFSMVSELGLRDDVRFVDYVRPEDLPGWYNAADLFAYPSAYEGFGLPLVEAMACGAPVITSASSSLMEVVGNAGLTVETGSEEALRSGIERLLEDRHLRDNLRSLGLERARIFTWEATAAATVGVYERVVGTT